MEIAAAETLEVVRTFRTTLTNPKDLDIEARRIVHRNYGDKAFKSIKIPYCYAIDFEHEVENATDKYRICYDIMDSGDNWGMVINFYVLRKG
jgi:hypothetical protein